MKRNWKFHALAISAICVIIIFLYVAIGPKAPAPVSDAQLVGDRYIQIYSATFGINCNDYIDQLNDQRAHPQDHPANAGTDPKDNKPIPRIVADNALIPVGNLCNGKLTCTFNASTETLGGDPLNACFKRLTIGYRCFSYDRLQQMEINQGDDVTIDCTDHAS